MLFGIALFFCLTGLAWAHVGTATIRNRETVKSWLVESGFYDNVVDTVLEAANQQESESGEADIPVDDPQIQAITKDAFSPGYLQENVEKVLDGTYAWLEGRTPKPEFIIDVSMAKQKLADGLANYAVSRAANLPACTPDQMAAMTDDYDALNATCLPPGVSPQAAAENLRYEILTNEEFLGDTTFSGDDFKIEENGQKVAIADSQFRRAQTVYKVTGYGPYIFGVLAVLMAAAVFFVSSTRRNGLRRVGIIFISSGLLLGLSYLAYNRSSSWLNSRAQDLSGETSAGRELAAGLVDVIGKDISSLLLWYAIGFTAIGVIGVLISIFYKRQRSGDKPKVAEPKPPVDDSPKDEPAQTDKPVSPRKEAADGKKPKPPTKIQL